MHSDGGSATASIRVQKSWRTRAIGLGRAWIGGCLILVLLAGCSPGNQPASGPDLRGTWVQAQSIRTPDRADAILARAEAGRLNAVLVNVFADGHVYYESDLLPKHPKVEPDFDPLAYLVDQAHQRGLAVHAWLVAGPVGYNDGPGPILAEHPDWAMVGPDGRQNTWLNYTRPDVRQFLADLVLELVTRYKVDGVHFDYTRYPGSAWGYDPYSAQLLAQERGIDLEELRYAALPAYARYRGNPLIWPDTAQVLATFDGHQPAVLLNRYGDGTAILLNWDASERQVAVGSEILDRSIAFLLDEGGTVHVLRSETNAARYGTELFDQGIAWLKDLGWQPDAIDDAAIATLDARDVLVLPNVYRIDAKAASDLAGFVRNGGGVVWIDGPTPSILDKNIRAITGMRMRGKHFERTGLLVAAQEHEIIPTGANSGSLAEAEALDAQWKAFRMEGINRLLQEVYQRVKKERPDVLVSITVSGNQTTLAEDHLLDWRTWLQEGTVDLIIPRAYVAQNEPLAPVIANWQPVMHDAGKIVLGLSAHVPKDEETPKTPQRVLEEIEMAQAAGSGGFVLFDLEHTSDEVLGALAGEPPATPGTTPD